MKNIKAVILAAGLGTRMKSDLPKVLHPVGSGTMLGMVVGSLKEAGIKDIIAVVGHGSDLIRKTFAKDVSFVEQDELLGSGDALKRAMRRLEGFEGDVLVTCGDTPLVSKETFRRILEKHSGENAACTILTCFLDDPFSYGRIVRNAGGDVLKIVEEKDAGDKEKNIREINVGTYCFKAGEARAHVRDIKLNQKKQEFYLTDIVDIMAGEGKRIASASCGPEESIGVNSRKELAMVNKIVNRKVLDKHMESGVTIIDPESTFIADGVKIGRDTVIYPCSVIEEDVEIASGCRIGPFARIRPGSRLASGVEIGNYAEICRTSIGENTKVKHQTYLGDAVVGKDVNIGAGTITANWDGEKKHRTVIKDNAFIGIGALLVAPVEIGKGARVGAGSVVTKNKNVPDGETVAGIPARPLHKQS